MATANPNTNKPKTESQPKPSLKISHSKEWNEKGVKVKIAVIVVADRIENRSGRNVRFFDAGSHKTLSTKTSDAKGCVSYSFSVPIGKFKQGMKKKIGIELIAKIGSATKFVEKQIFDEIEIDLGMPTGFLKKGVQAAVIRKNKHYKDFFLAVTQIALFVAYVRYAGNTSFSLFVAISAIAILAIWWVRSKSIFRTIFCAVLLLSAFVSLTVSPVTFSAPLIRGAILSLLIGMPFYLLEELWRKPDGSSVKNCYPTWPIVLCFAGMMFLTFDIFGNFLPRTIESVDILDPDAFLNSETSWSFLNNIPFLWHVDFRSIARNLDWIVSLFVAGCILLVYGGSRELMDWYKSVNPGKPSDISTGGFAGIIIVLKQVLDFVMDVVLPLVGLRNKRGK